jgi:phenylalanyl-tRNA synthetase beta chain
MKISYNWLKELLDFEADAAQVAELLTMSGSEVEAIDQKGRDISGICSAKILDVKAHPKADKLTICLVHDGKGKIAVVCGAPNVKPGQNVLFGGIGAKIAGGKTLEKTAIRDIESSGMILAEDELGISADHTEIIELPEDIKPGTPLEKIVKLDDHILELEITPNRPDCLSHIGIARELKAILGGHIKYPKILLSESELKTADDLTIEIVDSDACPRYTGRLVSDVKIGPSPLWLKARLYYLGMRPINNIVDVTNYVMMETGQPLHAFDYAYFQTKKVVVRKATAGEKFITLDNIERTLNADHLLITDGEKGVALAGIMGGQNSEVSEKAQQILLESAYFDPITIRYGARRIGLSTESSQRFERGADPLMAPVANDRACQMMAEIADGHVHKGIVDIYPKIFAPAQIDFRTQRARSVLGMEIGTPDMKNIFNGLDIKYIEGSVLKVIQPSFRPDLTREIDLIEEVARIHGLDKIPESYRPGGNLLKDINPAAAIKDRLRAVLIGMGFVETFPLTLVDAQQIKKIDESIELLTLQNPLSEEMSGMRPDLIITMLRTLKHNINYGNRDLKLFDIGYAYMPSNNILPDEKEMLCLGITGREYPLSWRNPDKQADTFTLKGIIELILGNLDIDNLELMPAPFSYFEPDYSFTLSDGRNILGRLGKVASGAGRILALKQDAYIAELDFAMIAKLASKNEFFRPLPKFPGSDRDIALIVDQNLHVKNIMQTIQGIGGDIIEDLFPFDLYLGKNIPSDKKSIAFRICYRHPERTLTDSEIDEITQRIIVRLNEEYGAVLRA